ncbi:MAG: hypothetical protein FJ045_01490 [Crenarchaeota archaeon]|nr:hypothetical protein [Thermoproteota archaeon]
MRRRIEIPAARRTDLENILKTFGIPPGLDDDSVHCCQCNESITWDNLGGMFIQNNKLILFCNLTDCVEKVAQLQLTEKD